MKTHKPTKTATIKDMRSLTNAAEKHATVAEEAAEKARLYVAAGRNHANVAESAATRTKVYAQNADDHAKRAELNAEDAANYAHTARWCLILTMLINAIILCIILCK